MRTHRGEDHRVHRVQILYSGHSGGRHGSSEGGLLHRLRLYDGDRVVSCYIVCHCMVMVSIMTLCVSGASDG